MCALCLSGIDRCCSCWYVMLLLNTHSLLLGQWCIISTDLLTVCLCFGNMAVGNIHFMLIAFFGVLTSESRCDKEWLATCLLSMSIINLYSAESWSISTALCVLSGNTEISLSSTVVWNGRCWAPGHGDCDRRKDNVQWTVDVISTDWHQLPLIECTFPTLLFLHRRPFSCLRRTW